MPAPGDLLRDDESLLYGSRPSWTALVWPVTVGAAVLAGAVAVVVVWSGAPIAVGWALLAAVVLAAGFVTRRVLRWRSTLLVVTSRRVLYRAGVLRRSGREIPVERVEDVSFHQGLFQRLARAGSVTVESAGERGALPFVDVARPGEFQAVVHEAAGAARARLAGGAGAGPGAERPPTVAEQLAQLAELRDRGVLTEGEFARAKSDLLGSS